MPQAIASSSTSPVAAHSGNKASPASLQAQLQRYKQQLSDCVHCASAKTPQGKAAIDAITARINQVKLSIADSATDQSARPIGASQTVAAAGATTTLGSRIDVFA